jgi:hypothetical protein
MYAADSQVGTWKLNLAKSTYVPANLAPKSSTTKIEATADGGIKVTVDGVDADSKTVHYTFTAKYDGKDYPVTGDANRDTVSYTRIDANTVTSTSKKAGKVTTTAKAVYSADGKTRTLTVTGTNAQGQKVTNTQVYDKQ